MANQYYNIYYDPMRQGYDSSTWATLTGEPVVLGNRLKLKVASILHYGDILRGDAIFNVNIPAPAIGEDKKFGFLQFNKNSYLYFKSYNGSFTAETSDGSTTNSIAITWQTAWSNTNTEFRVKWEAGFVSFYVGGVLQTQISDASVSGSPMSLYVADNSDNDLLLNYIEVKGIQSYIMSEGNENKVSGINILESEGVNITESVTMLMDLRFIEDESDSITISESVTVAVVGP